MSNFKLPDCAICHHPLSERKPNGQIPYQCFRISIEQNLIELDVAKDESRANDNDLLMPILTNNDVFICFDCLISEPIVSLWAATCREHTDPDLENEG